MNCPDCGGAMWDNRANKRNPKGPDFKCKNDSCKKAVWEKPSGTPTASNGNGHAPVKTSARPLGPIYAECLEFAKKACVHHFGDKTQPEDVIAAAATLFIAAVRDGAPIRAAKPAPPPPPPPPPVPEPVPGPDFYNDDDNLPF